MLTAPFGAWATCDMTLLLIITVFVATFLQLILALKTIKTMTFKTICVIAEPAGKARQRSSIAKEIW